ncbi:50S ribosomal protein L28 [Deinococcus aquiradiocola]|uniref:Large ribosomal subunit protein bL28 n=1 Tax=Deinococcus aquiradiocola TaxID=393059 RepID=A0A917ULL5_9DEIO|nr:50S ribosomal protein L28 [Deinococcus aquiradiocola]GGJ66524.1 50S ribosomal protein L28 [Deinococcus aquiradiocola]
MSRKCSLTGRSRMVVHRVTRRGRARAAGGVGRKVTGKHRRVQKANLQKKRVLTSGTVRTVWLSARALRSVTAGRVPGVQLR